MSMSLSGRALAGAAAALLASVGVGLGLHSVTSDLQGHPGSVRAAAGTTGSSEDTSPNFIERRDPDDPLAVGAVDAPVVLVAFGDYQCGHCASWSTNTMTELQHLVDEGTLRIEWRDLNIFGEGSARAARAGWAAGRQDAFLDYHHALFPQGKPRPPQQLTDRALVGLAGELGLDTERFARDMASQEAKDAIAQNQQLGYSLGASSTPAFMLDRKPLLGDQPVEVFERGIERALAERESEDSADDSGEDAPREGTTSDPTGRTI
ncbi:DsbA family protein [Micrococcus luteus]